MKPPWNSEARKAAWGLHPRMTDRDPSPNGRHNRGTRVTRGGLVLSAIAPCQSGHRDSKRLWKVNLRACAASVKAIHPGATRGTTVAPGSHPRSRHVGLDEPPCPAGRF